MRRRLLAALRQRRVLLPLAGAAALAVLVLAVVGWRIWQVRGDLNAARDDAQQLRDAIAQGDTARARALQDQVREHAENASSGVDGPVWSVLARLPRLGDDARAVRAIAHVAGDLAAQALPSLEQVSDDRSRLLPKDGRISPAAVAELRTPVARAAAALSQARTTLDATPSRHLMGPVARAWDSATGEIDDLASAASAAKIAVDVLPGMLGGDGERRYLLVLQNSAEVRSTGGLGGAVVELVSKDGRIRLARQVPGNTLVYPEDVVRPTAAESDNFGELPTRDFRETNQIPDFPRVAEVWRDLWQKTYPGRVDGVIATDPVLMAALLKVTGPVTVQGIEVNADNAVSLLLSETYRRFPDPADQDRFFQGVAATAFTRLTAGTDDISGLLSVLREGVEQRRILVRSFESGEQREIATTAIAGVLPREATTTPEVGLYRNDGSGSKIAFYLRTRERVTAVSCIRGRQQLRVVEELRSTLTPAQAKALPDYPAGPFEQYGFTRGTQLLKVVAYGPVRGRIDALTVNGQPVDTLVTYRDGRRTVATSTLYFEPGDSVRLVWEMTSGPGQTAAPHLEVTPGVVAPDATAGPSACRAG